MVSINHEFPELISPFLREKIAEAESRFGKESNEYLSIARQFLRHPAEDIVQDLARLRHYDADMKVGEDAETLKGMERLYRRTVVLELTTSCFAHCRWCLRSNYHRFSLRKEEISANISLIGSKLARDTVREILITGGDPLTTIQRLDFTLSEIARITPNIEIVRIGTRAFTLNPLCVDEDLVQMLTKHLRNFRIEIGSHINSPQEFWPESVEALSRIRDLGIVIYNQHPLLKGVNDSIDTLVELYDSCRHYAIEPHYLFHCVPMRGMQHHRTSIAKGLDLIRKLTSGGYFSGRAKPHYAAMTDIGKITFYEGSILKRRPETNEVLLQSGYSINERLSYNPGFRLTKSMEVDDNGFLRVWYPDGVDDNFWGD